MKAISFHGQLELIDAPIPRRHGEALIQVSLAGICQTDIEITKGYMGFQGILGHEFVGTIIECPHSEQRGRRVVGEINIPCGACDLCRKGLGKHCRTRDVVGIHNRSGAFAEYISVPMQNLHFIPDSVGNEIAVFTEPIAAALEILEQIKIKPSSKVLIIGDGRLGLLSAMVIRLMGCNLFLVGRHPEKTRIFHQLGGSIMELSDLDTCCKNFDIVIEASGNPSGLYTALQAVRPLGCIVLKSTYAGGINLNLSQLVVDEVTILGSRCGPFEPALRLMEQGLIDPTPLITNIYPVDQYEKAFIKAQSKDAIKVLISFEENE
jgi:alcohol dehydrogenase